MSYKATLAASLLSPPRPAPAKGWSANDLFDARNECGPSPGGPGFPPHRKALVWASLYLVAALNACV